MVTSPQRRGRKTVGTLCTMAVLGAPGLICTTMAPARAQMRSVQIPVYQVTNRGTGVRLGSLRFSQTNRGIVVQANVQGLLPGRNSMHIHQVRSCAPALEKGQLVPGAAAGPHWDPTGVMGLHGHGHHGAHGHQGVLPLGDLPDLIANAEGISTSMVAATRLTSLDQILGRSVIVHRGPDGPKFACGLLPQ